MIEKAEVTALLQQLTAIKSAYFHEDEIMAFARDWLCRQELPAQLHEYHDAKVTDFHGKNVIAVIDGGRPGPVICLNGHLDTVQLCGGWTRDPYGELDGQALWCGRARHEIRLSRAEGHGRPLRRRPQDLRREDQAGAGL